MNTTAVTSAAAMSETMTESVKLLRKIGFTTYQANAYLSNKSGETLGNKIFRFIERELCELTATQKPLQTDRLPERSSL